MMLIENMTQAERLVSAAEYSSQTQVSRDESLNTTALNHHAY